MKMLSKKLTFLIVFCAFTSSISFSQKLITKEEISTNKIAEIFKNAYVEVLSVQDSYLKVKDVFTAFIDIDADKRFISISGNYSFQPNTPKNQILELINKINREVIMVKCYYKESNNSINYVYYYWVEGGFTDTSLIKAYKLYNTALRLSLKKDSNQIIQ